MEGGHFDPFGDNNDDNDDDEKSFLKALQLRWGALKNQYFWTKIVFIAHLFAFFFSFLYVKSIHRWNNNQ